MAKYGLAIQLDRCVGCGTCALACKTENNTHHKTGGTTFNWSDFLTFTDGTYPGVKFRFYPVNCNHCTDAPCVAICTALGHNALYKTADGITMLNQTNCVGCQSCQDACPYSNKDVDADGVQYSVLSFNSFTSSEQATFWAGTTEIIAGGTSSPAGMVTAAGETPPDHNVYTHPEYTSVRPAGVVEKCYFCDHRLQNGENPYCVDSCPTQARTFGDLNDPTSEISQLLAASGYKKLRNNAGEFLYDDEPGTSPNVYYIGEGTTGPGVAIEEITGNIKPHQLSIYPNPVSDNAYAEFELDTGSKVTLSLYDITGKQVMQAVDKEYKPKGKHKVEINVSRLKAGTFICRLLAGEQASIVNMVVTR